MFFSKRKKNFLKEQYYQNKSLIQLFSWIFITFSILAENYNKKFKYFFLLLKF